MNEEKHENDKVTGHNKEPIAHLWHQSKSLAFSRQGLTSPRQPIYLNMLQIIHIKNLRHWTNPSTGYKTFIEGEIYA